MTEYLHAVILSLEDDLHPLTGQDRTGLIQLNLDFHNVHPYIQASSPRLPLS